MEATSPPFQPLQLGTCSLKEVFGTVRRPVGWSVGVLVRALEDPSERPHSRGDLGELDQRWSCRSRRRRMSRARPWTLSAHHFSASDMVDCPWWRFAQTWKVQRRSRCLSPLLLFVSSKRFRGAFCLSPCPKVLGHNLAKERDAKSACRPSCWNLLVPRPLSARRLTASC